ncbi:MAG TPA: TonB-dependent receptor plug domain-containing protein, partial [Hanamia sp.]|nr:TonB-dependent receptor plug domain-containing protein [Hanamia sp.]
MTGVVTNKDSETPLIGATVKSNEGTVQTDTSGRFSIPVKFDDIITFTYVGMQPFNYKYRGERGPISISLSNSSDNLSEIVVTGYESQRKVDLTGSVAVVKLSDIQDIPNNNPMQALQGRVPGLYVSPNGGDPSGNNNTIAIRGFNTLGFTSPLYVIDGVSTIDPSVFQSLSPSSIENIQILKDASSESIYGSRASNGVIIVTTKQGAKGKVRIQFDNNITQEKYVTRTNVLNGQGLGKAIWQAAINDGDNPNSVTTLYSYVSSTGTNGNQVLQKVNITPYLGGDSAEPAANTDWQNVMFKPGIITSNSLTISTGSDNSSLLINLNYLNNSGLIVDNNG